MLRVSDVTSFITCPRLAYFRIHHWVERATEYHAAREIYLSLRKGYGYEWAFERFSTLFPESEDVFRAAASKFRMSDELEGLQPVAWEVHFESERLGLRGVVDEVLEGDRFLVVMLTKNSEEFTFRERMRLAALCAISGMDGGYAYYAYDGKLMFYSASRRDRYNLLRLLEKLRRIEKGFLPERKESERCEFCEYRESCETKPSTFLSRFF
ncbi:hypothetical protein GAH_00552 [Geoglobus ahangari]|uniref:Uncharacterized protein n=1 Tax=Geoglobus ahangari TaxID=113653 RepID=A0A0F7IG01_9EURY|nr:PD-(D/E)XK nuclease family protein [Geoglobus ahangari]AKG92103.1 hypothetical protein GAH_00552 [Geoglobus ahangari]